MTENIVINGTNYNVAAVVKHSKEDWLKMHKSNPDAELAYNECAKQLPKKVVPAKKEEKGKEETK